MEGQQNQVPTIKYPNAFLYGAAVGTFFNIILRKQIWEPLSARPFSYLTYGFGFGLFFKYFDYHRRLAVEQVLISEDQARYYNLVKAVNSSRVGEEDEMGNLVDYLSNQTVRP